MNNDEKKIKIKVKSSDESIKKEPETKPNDDSEIKHVKDCKDNCMHCGYHCKYLKD